MERRLDEVTDPFTALPEDTGPAAALAAEDRWLVEGVERRDLEVEPYGPRPIDVPAGPDWDLGL